MKLKYTVEVCVNFNVRIRFSFGVRLMFGIGCWFRIIFCLCGRLRVSIWLELVFVLGLISGSDLELSF